MATLDLLICPDPRRLLEAAADGFLEPLRASPETPFPSPGYLLALRQGGIRDDLIRLAATRGVGGWFDPPLCVFHELPRWLGSTGRKPLGAFERHVLLARVVREATGEVFGRLDRADDFVDAVDRLVGELISEEVAPEALERAFAKAPSADEFERRRNTEIAAVYRHYVEHLERAGARDGRDTYADCARALAATPGVLAERLGGRREIRLFGLLDTRGGWRILLDALQRSPALDRIALYAMDEAVLEEGLDAQVTHLDPTIARSPDRAMERTIDLLSAPDADRETEEVARRVRVLIDSGVEPARIALVSRKARPHVDLAVRALERFGVPAAARRRIGFTEIPVVRGVATLFAAAAEGWTRHALVELAEQPYLASDLDAGILNLVGYRSRVTGLQDWSRALGRLEADAARQESEGVGDDGYRPTLPPAERVRAARASLAAFAERAAVLDRPRPLVAWLDWLTAFLEHDPWRVQPRMLDVPAGRFDIARLDLVGWRALTRVAREWREAAGRWGDDGDLMTASEFHEQLRHLLSGDAALWTPWHRGVRVLEGLAAAYRSFDHLFVLGLEAGRFPAPPPSSPILDETDRAHLREAGIPLEPRERFEARERALFWILAGSAEASLTLSCARLDTEGKEVAESSFLETVREAGSASETAISPATVLTPGMPVVASNAAREQAAHATRIERERETGDAGPWNGLVADEHLCAWIGERFAEDYVWSPSQLESYAKCPWAFFSGRLLRVEKFEEPGEDMDAATWGTILHDALNRLYTAAGARAGSPVFLREGDLEWVVPLAEQALGDALADQGSESWLGHPALRDAQRERLRRTLVEYVEWEVLDVNEKSHNKRTKLSKMVRMGVVEHEKRFSGVVLERNGIRFTYRGIIDRVERGVDEDVDASRYVGAVDYKSGMYGVPGAKDFKQAWEDGVVLQVPLYAHALTELIPGSAIAYSEYRALRQRKAVHTLQLQRVDRKAGTVELDEEAEARMERALDDAAAHVGRVRAGTFPAAPPPSCHCPSYCHAREICRVVGGPRELFG